MPYGKSKRSKQKDSRKGGDAIVRRKNHPEDLIRMLYEIADDAEAPANSRLSAIKEILDRTVGKGTMLDGADEEPEQIEILFRIEDGRSSSA
jgi:hypothetical protein